MSIFDVFQKQKSVNVLSLFGGIECGLVALKNLGIDIEEYYSSEIDPYAIKITTANHPEVVHIGSITDVKYRMGELQWIGGGAKTEIDLMIWGSPCQDLSIAKANGKWLNGEKSGLFFEYMRLLTGIRPRYFLLENVASMKKADRDEITRIIGVEPIMINSALVSAQNRKRLYWVWKKTENWYEKVEIPQPDNRWILLSDILEDIPLDDKRWKPLDEKYINEEFIEKIKKWSATLWKFRRGSHLRIHADQENSPTLTSNMGTGGNNVPIIISEKAYPVTATYAWACPRDFLLKHQRELVIWKKEEIYHWRKLTTIECERLQTLPDWYTSCVSDSRRYKAIWNGWTVDVIAHILSFAK